MNQIARHPLPTGPLRLGTCLTARWTASSPSPSGVAPADTCCRFHNCLAPWFALREANRADARTAQRICLARCFALGLRCAGVANASAAQIKSTLHPYHAPPGQARWLALWVAFNPISTYYRLTLGRILPWVDLSPSGQIRPDEGLHVGTSTVLALPFAIDCIDHHPQAPQAAAVETKAKSRQRG